MKSVHEYLDYRIFLKDFHGEAQMRNPNFSVRAFLKKAGIGNPSFFKQIVDGQRNLTERTLNQFLKALHLPPPEDLYFRNLVHFCQAKTAEEKQLFYTRLRSLGEQAKVRIVGSENYSFYEHWYVPVLRELLPMHNFQDDWVTIGKCLQPNISATEARQATHLLVELGFITKNADGRYEQAEKLLHTGYEIHSLAVRNFHKQMIQMAGSALEDLPASERSVTGVTLSISPSAYAQLEEEIRNFQERILSIANQDQGAQKVLQLHVALFPVGQIPERLP